MASPFALYRAATRASAHATQERSETYRGPTWPRRQGTPVSNVAAVLRRELGPKIEPEGKVHVDDLRVARELDRERHVQPLRVLRVDDGDDALLRALRVHD